MDATPATPVPPPPTVRASRRWRKTALFGLLASVMVASSFGLPWVHIAGLGPQELRSDLEREVDRRGEVGPAAEVLVELTEQVADSGTLRGVDIARWARAASEFAPHAEPAGAAPDPLHLAFFDLTRGAVLGVLFGAFALAVGFALTRLRAGPSPLLAGALLVGCASVVMGLGVHAVAVDLGEHVQAGWGARGLVVGGGLLLLVGLLGMRRTTWWKALLLFGAGAFGVVKVVQAVLDTAGAS